MSDESLRRIIRDYLKTNQGSTKESILEALAGALGQDRAIESHRIETLLHSIAMEVHQPVKKNLFENQEPDLFGSHVQSRWYLTLTPNNHGTEQVQEDPNELEINSLDAYLRQHPKKRGTLGRIRRFGAALVRGTMVPGKAHPRNNMELLKWLKECRRAGLYDYGRLIFEKGGLNLANLTDEQQIEAEDDYRICARRGSTEEAKPKGKRRKTTEEDA
jgi:hypothetical protein